MKTNPIYTIYIAEDEKNIRNLIESFLKNAGYQVRAFATGDALYAQFKAQPADLLILDVMMPGADGFTILTNIRQTSNVPIIMLTAKDTDEDYIKGISLGSDAYFTKPFSPVQLVMQVKAMLRRARMNPVATSKQPVTKSLISYADITLKLNTLTALCHGQTLKLTNTEFSLLSFLFEHQERAVSRAELLIKIWGYHSIVETRATDDTIKRLRKKLTQINSCVQIETVRGYGFKLSKKDD